MVNPVQAVVRGFAGYVSFDGRATRAEYWWWWLFTGIGGVVSGVIDWMIGQDFLKTLFILAVLLPTSAVTSRRLHDIGKPSWWKIVWLASTVPAWLATGIMLSVTAVIKFRFRDAEGARNASLGIIDWSNLETFSSFAPDAVVLIVVVGASLAVIVWSIIWLARQGEAGQNRFGPDPRE